MDAHLLKRRIDALLNDSMVSLMIQADGVDRDALARQLLKLRPMAIGLRNGDKMDRDKKPRGEWRRVTDMLCGACA
jgi:hypothetical protein